jgi:opacity protein-like surface antigen
MEKTDMYRTIIATATLATLLQLSPAAAQGPWGIQLRGNGAIATQDQDRETTQEGFGFGATIDYFFMPHVAAYAAWDLTHFAAHEMLGANRDLEETGYALGLRYQHPIRALGRTDGWVRAGAMYNHMELENDEGDVISDSGHDLGWEAGAGLAFGLNNGWSVNPGFRYRSLSRDLDVAGASVPVELQYVAFEIGVARRF